MREPRDYSRLVGGQCYFFFTGSGPEFPGREHQGETKSIKEVDNLLQIEFRWLAVKHGGVWHNSIAIDPATRIHCVPLHAIVVEDGLMEDWLYFVIARAEYLLFYPNEVALKGHGWLDPAMVKGLSLADR